MPIRRIELGLSGWCGVVGTAGRGVRRRRLRMLPGLVGVGGLIVMNMVDCMNTLMEPIPPSNNAPKGTRCESHDYVLLKMTLYPTSETP